MGSRDANAEEQQEQERLQQVHGFIDSWMVSRRRSSKKQKHAAKRLIPIKKIVVPIRIERLAVASYLEEAGRGGDSSADKRR
jgi:hypothetical protein